jgi:gluconate kinase
VIVHLNGWPGVGKKTIGDALSRKLGARFIHNHLLHDVAIVCAGLTSPDRWELYETVRSSAYNALVRRPDSEVFVMTNALCKSSDRERIAWRHVVDLARAREAPLIPVVLEVSIEENCRRLQSSDRAGKKLTDPDALLGYMAIDAIQKPDVPELLVLDATALTPEQAADGIRRHIESIKDVLNPASERHLRLL